MPAYVKADVEIISVKMRQRLTIMLSSIAVLLFTVARKKFVL
jgi:hypothetical protein